MINLNILGVFKKYDKNKLKYQIVINSTTGTYNVIAEYNSTKNVVKAVKI
jgi:hypothetical protein